MICNLIRGSSFAPFSSLKFEENNGDGDWFSAAGVAALGGLALNGAGAISSMINNDKQLSLQKELAYNQQQLAVNSEIANRWFVDQQNKIARDWQEKEWTRQFNLQNEYNTPYNQVHRLLAAGINPYASFNNTGTAQGSSPNTPIASTPSGATGSSFGGSVIPNYMNPFAAGAQMAESFKVLAEAKKAGVETDKIEQMLSRELKKLDLENAYQDTKNSLLELFGSKREQAEIDKLLRQTALLAVQEQGGVYENVSKSYEAEFAKLREYSKAHLGYAEYHQAKVILRNLQRQIDSALSVQASQVKVNEAVAENQTSQSKVNQQTVVLRSPDELSAREFAVQYNTPEGKAKLSRIILNNIERDTELSEEQKDRAYEAAANALWDRELVGVHKAEDEISRVLEEFLPFYKAKQLSRLAGAAERNTERRNRSAEADIDHYENWYEGSESGSYMRNGKKTNYNKSGRFRKTK